MVNKDVSISVAVTELRSKIALLLQRGMSPSEIVPGFIQMATLLADIWRVCNSGSWQVARTQGTAVFTPGSKRRDPAC